MKHGLDFEVDADCTDERRRERVVRVAEQERRLADAAVADDEQLEHVVEVLIGRIFRRRRLHLDWTQRLDWVMETDVRELCAGLLL